MDFSLRYLRLLFLIFASLYVKLHPRDNLSQACRIALLLYIFIAEQVQQIQPSLKNLLCFKGECLVNFTLFPSCISLDLDYLWKFFYNIVLQVVPNHIMLTVIVSISNVVHLLFIITAGIAYNADNHNDSFLIFLRNLFLLIYRLSAPSPRAYHKQQK